MRRIAGLLGVGVLVMLGGPAAAGGLPVASLSPNSGAAGDDITVNVSQYSPSIVIEVHEGDSEAGPLIGSGMTGPGGTGSFPITIPAEWSVGGHLVYICGLCDAQFPEWATRNFSVTSSSGTTTTSTTEAASTTTSEATTTTAAVSTTTASAAAPTTTAAAATSTSIVAAAPGDDGESSSRGLLIGLLTALLIAIVLFEVFLIRGQRRRRQYQPPPPPPPPAV